MPRTSLNRSIEAADAAIEIAVTATVDAHAAVDATELSGEEMGAD